MNSIIISAFMVIVLLVFGSLFLVANVVLLAVFWGLRRRHEAQRLILTATNASEDIGYILNEILVLMKRELSVMIASSVVVIAEEAQLRVLYPSEPNEGRVYRFFSSLNRSMMYQFLLQCVSVTKNIFATSVLTSSTDVSLTALSIFQRFQNQRKGKFAYLVIPIYDKEIAGLVVFEVEEAHFFTYEAVKRLQKSMPILNVVFSRVLLLWNLRLQSITDPLTGLLNKRQFTLMAEKLFSIAKRKQHSFALAILDIDKFKHINDAYGHHVGDIILKDIAEVLIAESRQSDYVFRVGGDEFCVLFSDIPSVEEIRVYSDRIYDAVKDYQERKPSVVEETITVSFGWAVETESSGWVEVFEKADKHMYEQKRKHHENHWYSR